MTKSEELLSAFSENFFFKELVFDSLHFTPDGGSEVELADLLINLGDIIIAIQLKERNEKHQTHDIDKEMIWFQKKCKAAKSQVKDTLEFISSGELPAFTNKRGQRVFFSSDAEMIPLVVFKNDTIISYPHLLEKHSDEGININCMSFEDFEKMCRMLSSPIEIVEYLKYRKIFAEKNGDVNYSIFTDDGESIIITKPNNKEALIMQFLAEEYGVEEAEKHLLNLSIFRSLLYQIPEHIIETSEENGSINLLTFFAHMNRCEISTFLEQLESTKLEAFEGSKGMLHSIRREDGAYVIVFVSGTVIPIEALWMYICETKNIEVKHLLEIVIEWIDDVEYDMNFYLG